MNKERLYYIVLIILVLITIVLLYNNNSNSVEHFSDNEELQDILETKINKLQNARIELKNALEKKRDTANYKKEYYEQIKKDMETKIKNNKDQLKNGNTEVADKIVELNSSLKRINILLNYDMNNKNYNSIKSLQNGTKIAISPVNNKFIENNQDNQNIKYYLISVNKNYVTSDEYGNICLQPKLNNINKPYKNNDFYDDKQLFKIQKIVNETDYRAKLDNGLLINKYYDFSNVVYPFSILVSKYNKNCLQNFNNNLSLMTCKPFKSHRFEPLEESLSC